MSYLTILITNFVRKYPLILSFYSFISLGAQKMTRVRAHVLFSTLPSQQVEGEINEEKVKNILITTTAEMYDFQRWKWFNKGSYFFFKNDLSLILTQSCRIQFYGYLSIGLISSLKVLDLLLNMPSQHILEE